ncbi:TIM barrel protein [Zavarzinella formosa]|uniref:TIM barrel protein n=1 Tax=Zavarzinella formosa TaxID=360055 RepID=UPI0003048DE2|nr:TIM barrel protein [Zavarzinella formosa]
MFHFERRDFLKTSAILGASAALPWAAFAKETKKPLFDISLAQWSLHKAFFAKKLDPVDFAKIAKNDYGILAVEYVNQFYKDKKKDDGYVKELKKRCDDLGVRSVLIMCDGEGALGDADEKKRTTAVENHIRWIEWAKTLGCHSIRVNAQSSGTYEEQMERAADGLHKLCELGDKHEINVIVENHGGLSSNGEWLAATIKKAAHPRCGTLPDFGNFNLGNGKQYDRYKGVQELMPFAKGVSAKTHDFDDKGNEIHTDYRKMMKIVLAAGYSGYVGIEYEGGKIGESEGIVATKKLLETIREELAKG